MYSSGQPQAVIDGVLSSEGDIVGRTRIIKILPGSVFVALGEEEYKLKLR